MFNRQALILKSIYWTVLHVFTFLIMFAKILMSLMMNQNHSFPRQWLQMYITLNFQNNTSTSQPNVQWWPFVQLLHSSLYTWPFTAIFDFLASCNRPAPNYPPADLSWRDSADAAEWWYHRVVEMFSGKFRSSFKVHWFWMKLSRIKISW